MSTQLEARFKVYRIESSFIPIQAVAICTAYRDNAYIKAESYVLIQSSNIDTATIAHKISFSNNAGPNCSIVLDEEFALEEALRQAEIDFSLYVHELNSKSSVPFEWVKREFVEIPRLRLVGTWAHTPLKNELVRVMDATQCELLSNYLHSLSQLPTIELSPLAL